MGSYRLTLTALTQTPPTPTVISPFLKVPSLFTVGLVGSLLGYGTTHALGKARAALACARSDPANPPKANDPCDPSSHKEIPVLKTSLAVGAYLAVSTNLRYQLVSGVVEERIIARWLAGRNVAQHLASFAVRSCNTYIGSAMMIDFLKLVVRGLVGAWGVCWLWSVVLSTGALTRVCDVHTPPIKTNRGCKTDRRGGRRAVAAAAAAGL